MQLKRCCGLFLAALLQCRLHLVRCCCRGCALLMWQFIHGAAVPLSEW